MRNANCLDAGGAFLIYINNNDRNNSTFSIFLEEKQ
jgi:hypothetical protein